MESFCTFSVANQMVQTVEGHHQCREEPTPGRLVPACPN